MDWTLYNNYLTALGETERDELLQDTKDYFNQSAVNNLGYYEDIIYNGEKEKRRFLIQRTESYNKVKITAFPDEPLFSGDLLKCKNETLLVTGTYLLNEVQTVGTAWVCNITLRFQNGNSDIIEIPAALDDGTYSTTIGMEKNIQYLNKKLRIYVPYNEDTKKIFIDKRFAIEKMYDKYLKEQLVVYKVVGINHSSVTFGKESHLLELTVDSDNYSPSKDNLEEMICDYISPTPSPVPTEKLKCSIKGRPTVLLGSYKIYTPIFYNADGTENSDVEAIWEVSNIDGISTEITDNKIKVKVSDNEELIGTIFTLTLKDKNGLYEPCNMEVEVTT